MLLTNSIVDKAGKAYWDANWGSGVLAETIDPKDPNIKNHATQRFDEYFHAVFADLDTQRLKLLEVGCGNSAWLPYFAKEFGFEVWGLDYSEIGCEQEKMILARSRVAGKVVCADMFAPPAEMLSAFDVVVSFGVVEHFEDTAACVSAVGGFLKPTGLMFTMIPNMTGAVGAFQKFVNRKVFDVHQPIDAPALAAAHESAGCHVFDCDYFLSISFGVCNLNGVNLSSPSGFLKRVSLALLARLSMLTWRLERVSKPLPAGPLFAPYINCLAKKGGSTDSGYKTGADKP